MQYLEMAQRVSNGKPDAQVRREILDGVEREIDLHQSILDECARRGWIALHGSMAHRAFRTKGEWDFVVLADGGRTFLIEAKSRLGKLRPEQAALQMMAAKLGHKSFLVRSIEQFREAVDA